MDVKLSHQINEISNYRVSIYKNDFMMKVNDYQVLGVENKDKYEIDIFKNYNLIRKGIIDKNDVVDFLVYIKNKTI